MIWFHVKYVKFGKAAYSLPAVHCFCLNSELTQGPPPSLLISLRWPSLRGCAIGGRFQPIPVDSRSVAVHISSPLCSFPLARLLLPWEILCVEPATSSEVLVFFWRFMAKRRHVENEHMGCGGPLGAADLCVLVNQLRGGNGPPYAANNKSRDLGVACAE
jgi:hypothetical protein